VSVQRMNPDAFLGVWGGAKRTAALQEGGVGRGQGLYKGRSLDKDPRSVGLAPSDFAHPRLQPFSKRVNLSEKVALTATITTIDLGRVYGR